MQVENSLYDVIIIGGSYAGLSAALGLARSLCKVLIIDAGERCNNNVIHSHNLLTHDGEAPGDVAAQAREEVLKYKNVEFLKGRVVSAVKKDKIFEVTTETKETFTTRKLLLSTGLRDKIPSIPGMTECWGRSIYHCTFCHGYEVAGQPSGVLVPNEKEIPFLLLVQRLSKNLKIFTNGSSSISREWTEKFEKKGIEIIQSEIERFEHDDGQIKHLIMKDGSQHSLTAFFFRPPMEQQTSIPKELGCNINEMGLIQIDDFSRTNVPGVFATGDCKTVYRASSIIIGMGTKSAAFIVKELVDEDFAL